MGFPFNAEEILEMAAQIERNGARFYRHTAEGNMDPKSVNFSSISPQWKMTTKEYSPQ